MTIKTILVQLSPEGSNDAGIAFAAGLASQLQASLLGFVAAEVRVNVHRGMAPAAAAEIFRQEQQALEDRLAALGEAFLARAGEGAIWRAMTGNAESLLPVYSRAVDLIIMPPASHAGPDAPDPGAIILAAGRPVLLAGRDLAPLEPGTVLVAWKDTREARRAVSDALPLLQLAREVQIVSVIEADAGAARQGVEDVRTFLARHGVTARTELVEPTGGDVGAALVDAARAVGADLVVSGGYSRGPLRQRIFGGMTRSLIGTEQLHRLLSY